MNKRKSESGEAVEVTVSIESVPDKVALRDNLFYIVIVQKQGTKESLFRLPVQWDRKEALSLISLLRGIDCRLDEDDRPFKYYEIIKICEDFCDSQPTSPKDFRRGRIVKVLTGKYANSHGMVKSVDSGVAMVVLRQSTPDGKLAVAVIEVSCSHLQPLGFKYRPF